MRRAIVLLACTLLVPWVAASLLWDGLPHQIPVHFDLAGNPDGFEKRTWGNWFLLPIVVTVMTAWLGAVALSIPRTARTAPFMINTPNQDAFLRLTPEARERIGKPIAWTLVACLATVNLMFGSLVLASAGVAKGTWTALPAWSLLPFLGVMVVILVMGQRANRRILQREIAASSGGSEPGVRGS